MNMGVCDKMRGSVTYQELYFIQIKLRMNYSSLKHDVHKTWRVLLRIMRA